MRFALVAMAIILASLQIGTVHAETSSRPNIIFVLLDNLGWGEFGVYGGGQLRGAPTPRIDDFAAQGLRLTNFNVEASCMPTRSALMTGRYSIRSGTVRSGTPGIVRWEVTIAQLLQQQGYATGAFGKWHLGNEIGRYPTDRGFDEWYGIATTSHTALHRTSPGYDPAVTPPEYILESKRNESVQKVKEYTMDARREIDGELVDRTIAFIARNADENRPFYAYVPLTQVHYPSVPSKEFSGRTSYGDFADSVVQSDALIGKLLDAVDTYGLAKNTVVIVTSDNGPEYRRPWRGSAGVWQGTYHTAMEGGLRAPFMIRWSEHIKPRVSDDVVHAVDMFNTLAGLGSAPVPTDRPIDGVNQLPFFIDSVAKSARDGFPIYIEGKLFGAKWRDWKYHTVWLPDPAQKPVQLPKPYLFNVTIDPKEESPREQLEDYWVIGQLTGIIREIEKSLADNPPIPDNASIDYRPTGKAASFSTKN